MRNYDMRTIFLQYLLKLPELAGKMLPVCTLLASLFAFNRLKAHSELMGLLAGGYSSLKIYSIIFFSSLFIASIQYINLGYLQPLANKIKRQEFEKSRKNESRYLARSKTGDAGLNWYKSPRYFASFNFFDEKRNQIRDISLYFYNEDNKLYRYITAKHATYLQNGLWNFFMAMEYNSLDDKNFPVINIGEKLIVELSEVPEDFQQFKSDITTLYIGSLYSFVQKLKKSDINSTEYEILFLDKLSLALACISFGLFPVAGIFKPNRRSQSMGINIVITLVFTICFWVLQSGAQSLGNSNKIPPLMATMSAPILVLFYVFYLYRKNKKLSN